MKKTLLTLALVATSAAAFAQGKVQFVNDATRTYNLGSQVGAGVLSGPLTAASGVQLTASLYGVTGANGTALNLVTSVPLTGTSLSATAGRMATKSIAMAGIPGATVGSFAIVLTDVAAVMPLTINGTLLGRNAIDSLVDGWQQIPGAAYYGSSGLFTAIPGTSSVTYPPIYATTAPPGGVSSTWAAGPIYVNAIPEPSTFALAGLGAAAMLIFRRRK